MLKNTRKFITEFFKNGSRVGSITPSSSFLAEKMLRNIDFKQDSVIMEYGPGTGNFTKKIMEKMTPNSRLYIFELNPDFIETLRNNINDPRVKIICDSASNTQKYLTEDGIEEVDYIVSSLPLSLLPSEVRNDIVIQSHKNLKKGGIMTQFQYSQQCKKLFKNSFDRVSTDFTPFNFPPAFVYVCVK